MVQYSTGNDLPLESASSVHLKNFNYVVFLRWLNLVFSHDILVI